MVQSKHKYSVGQEFIHVRTGLSITITACETKKAAKPLSGFSSLQPADMLMYVIDIESKDLTNCIGIIEESTITMDYMESNSVSKTLYGQN